MAFDSDARIARGADVSSRVLEGEAVLLNLASGAYFGLDAVGTRFWELCQEPRTLGELRDALLGEFEVSRETLEHDLDELVRALETRGLVSRTGS